MKTCTSCGNSYPDPFAFCPVDGAPLEGGAEIPRETEEEIEAPRRERASVSVRTLMIGLAVLMLTGVLAFAGMFAYQYFRPKYGSLVIKTTPSGALIWVDGRQRGASPLNLEDMRAGGYSIRITREGYKELVQHVQVIPYSTESLHWTLEPLVHQLTNEQLAEVEALRKKLEVAQRENILLPPPDDYNVLYFADRILEIDPANAFAQERRNKLIESLRHSAELAYAREDWLEAERNFKTLGRLFPEDLTVSERLADIAAKIDASVKDRETQIQEWQAKAEAALRAGNLLPPEKDNALDALRNIERLDRRNAYARGAMTTLRQMLQNRGDTKIAGADWQGARNEFRTALQYFPDDSYSRTRLNMVEAKLAELAQAEQLRMSHMQEEQQYRQYVAQLRQSALNAYRSGSWDKAIAEWTEFLKADPESDEALYYIGASHLEQKHFDTAILHLEKCVNLNPNHVQAQLQLGLLYDRHRRDLVRSAEHLKKARELGGADRYSPDRLQAMIQDLQDRMQLRALENTPFAVEHKHAFSSCRGNLRLTPDGVEFKTYETDHSFYEAYNSLRSFTVSGDEISIRTRNNKKYNFNLLNSGDGQRVRRLAARHTPVG